METTERTYTELPALDPEGQPVVTQSPLLSDYPVQSVIYRTLRDQTEVPTVVADHYEAQKAVEEMPGHPRNTIVEAVEQGWTTVVRWTERSISVNLHLPAVWDGAKGPLFDRLETSAAVESRYSTMASQQDIGLHISWHWDWENDRYAYDKDSPSRITVDWREIQYEGQDRRCMYGNTYRISHEGISLKDFRNRYVAQRGPVSVMVGKAEDEAAASELEQARAAYEADADSAARVAERRALEAQISTHDHEVANNEHKVEKLVSRLSQSTSYAYSTDDQNRLHQQIQEGIAHADASEVLTEILNNDGKVIRDQLVTISGGLDGLSERIEKSRQTAVDMVLNPRSSRDHYAGEVRACFHLAKAVASVQRAVQYVSDS